MKKIVFVCYYIIMSAVMLSVMIADFFRTVYWMARAAVERREKKND